MNEVVEIMDCSACGVDHPAEIYRNDDVVVDDDDTYTHFYWCQERRVLIRGDGS